MFEMSDRLYDIFSTIIFVYIIYQLLGVKVNLKKTIFIVVSIIAVFWIISFLININEIVNNNIYVITLVIILSLYRVSGIFQVFVSTIITYNTLLMINDIFLNSLITFKNIASSTLYYNPITYSLVSIVFLVSDLIILVLLKHYKITLFEEDTLLYSDTINNKKKLRNIIFNRYNIIILVIVAQMWLLTMYFQINDSTMLKISSEVHSVQKNYITLIISTAIIILNIIVIFMVKNILMSEKKQYHYKVREKEFSQIKQQDLINRQYRHDQSNHLNLLKILVKERKYEELDSYLTNYVEEVNSNFILVKTGLEELDILINSKINIAQMKNIKVKYDCMVKIKCDKRNIINLISIIGNLLDNAIEASEKSKNRLIEIEINKNLLDYIFIIKNTAITNELVTSNIVLKEGYSTKGQGRGIGLSVVKRLVKKYSGRINIIREGEKLVFRIDLPIFELE